MGLKGSFIAIFGGVCASLALACVVPSIAVASSLIPQESSLGLDTVGYFHSTDDGPKGFQNSLSPELVGRWQAHDAGPVLEGGAQADLLLMFNGVSQVPSASTTSTYIEAPELYAGTSRQLAPVQLDVGRKLEQWNHLDEQWNLGIWQPRFRWDYLHPETVGLTGAFLRVEQPMFKLVVWGSPIFIPERGVPISTDGGQLSSASRWFIPPPSTVSLFGRDMPVQYSLMMPGLSDLVAHPGGSVMARVGRSEGAWGSVGYAYKPINQLFLSDTGYVQVDNISGDTHGVATIYPRVLYHELFSAEGGYETEPMKAWVSVLGEHPFLDQTPSDWDSQEATPSLAVSSTVDFRVAGSPERPTRLDISYLRQWGGNTGDSGPDAQSGVSNFEARYPYQSAVAMGVRSDAVARLSASTRVIYDIGHQGTIWSTEIRYQPRQSWVVGVGADLLTSLQTDDPEDADMISHFNANDRVHAGVTYVF